MGSWRRGLAFCALALATAATSCSSGAGDDSGTAGTTTSLPSGPSVPSSLPAGTAGTTTSLPGGPSVPSSLPAGPGGATGAPGQPSVGITTVGIGERVSAAGYELLVHAVTAPAPAPEPTAAPGPGNMLMSVDVELINRTGSQRDATYLRFEVVDAGGGHYQPSPHGQPLPTGFISADVPLRVQQLYEVPIQATSLVLTLRPDLVSTVAAAVRLR
jgi:hypothetical protein